MPDLVSAFSECGKSQTRAPVGCRCQPCHTGHARKGETMRCAYCNKKTDQEFCSDDCRINKTAFDDMLKRRPFGNEVREERRQADGLPEHRARNP